MLVSLILLTAAITLLSCALLWLAKAGWIFTDKLAIDLLQVPGRVTGAMSFWFLCFLIGIFLSLKIFGRVNPQDTLMVNYIIRGLITLLFIGGSIVGYKSIKQAGK